MQKESSGNAGGPVKILVPNLGSTSLKYQVLEMPGEHVLARGRMERVADYGEAVRQLRAEADGVDAVAFKTVHAGPEYRGTFRIDDGVIAAMEQFLDAAPVHNAIYLGAIRAFQKEWPEVPLVAAFETEFHRTIPTQARLYGVPREWRVEDGIERYGFHGASHQFIAGRAPEFLGRGQEDFRLISCHLGGSSSVCAIRDGYSVDTTMGFSPQSGLENATRHGDLDVFAVLSMMDRHHWDTSEVRRQLARESGLAGLSGVKGGDVRDIEAAERAGSDDARLALDVFAYEVRKTIGAYAAAMGGLDAVVFTGGIGENSTRTRTLCCNELGFLGVELDAERNEQGKGDRIISPDGAKVTVMVLATNEEVVVARRAMRVLA
ncbi:MAG: acetate/propionate family kinase [Bryobacteraceae bacterium]|nr:acetate/propionate family kinase [Bryobacteraceae bacterium]